jgi:BASS family bile acid:Na+ symporter
MGEAKMEVLSKAIPITMLTFVVSSMLSMGLSLTVGQILAPLRNYKLIVFALLGNFVLMPFAAFAVAKMLRLDQPLGIALILLGTASGAPFLPLLARISKGNLAFAVGLMVLLMVVTVAYMPLVLPLMLEGVSVDPVKIARSLVFLMLLPLAIGLLVKARLSGLAAIAQPSLSRLSILSLALLIALLLITNMQNVLSLYGTRGVLASVLFIAAGSAIGWVLGGPQPDTRGVIALGTAQRNIAAALVVGGQNFKDPRVIVMVVVVAIVGLLLLMPFARYLAKLSPLAIDQSTNASELQSSEQPAANGSRRVL